jgi:hypothetical protein
VERDWIGRFRSLVGEPDVDDDHVCLIDGHLIEVPGIHSSLKPSREGHALSEPKREGPQIGVAFKER